jgi:poly(A) polymerase
MQIKQHTTTPQLDANWIDPQAKEIVRVLQSSGYTSYLVGGCVRDLLCHIEPKDFDIATSALPQQVKRRVFGSYIIGKRFRLVLVKRGHVQYEIATFRREALLAEVEGLEDDKYIAENFFGTPKEDALRRDFTVNAIFYDPIKQELIDYVSATEDIKQRIIRIIGEPQKRILEDPIRILRALRLSHKLHFSIESELRKSMQECAESLSKTAFPRRREEFIKILRLKEPSLVFNEIHDLDLFKYIMPKFNEFFSSPELRELFLSFLDKTHELSLDSNSIDELYFAFSIGFIEAKKRGRSESELRSIFLELEDILKAEFGLFKSEFSDLQTSLDFYYKMEAIDKVFQRGPRRQKSILLNKFFLKALHAFVKNNPDQFSLYYACQQRIKDLAN